MPLGERIAKTVKVRQGIQFIEPDRRSRRGGAFGRNISRIICDQCVSTQVGNFTLELCGINRSGGRGVEIVPGRSLGINLIRIVLRSRGLKPFLVSAWQHDVYKRPRCAVDSKIDWTNRVIK